MTENSEIPYKEWLKKRRTSANDSVERAQALYDKDNNEIWTWLRDLFIENRRIYDNFEFVEDNTVEDGKLIIKIFNLMLGLDESATEEDLEERAKILGNLVEGACKFIDKAKQNEEKEQKMKDKVSKES